MYRPTSCSHVYFAVIHKGSCQCLLSLAVVIVTVIVNFLASLIWANKDLIWFNGLRQGNKPTRGYITSSVTHGQCDAVSEEEIYREYAARWEKVYFTYAAKVQTRRCSRAVCGVHGLWKLGYLAWRDDAAFIHSLIRSRTADKPAASCLLYITNVGPVLSLRIRRPLPVQF